MKSRRPLIVLLPLVALGTASLMAPGEAQLFVQPGPEKGGADLRMSVVAITTGQAKEAPVFRVTFENVGGTDTVLNLGMMLANGKIHLPSEIRLILTDPNGGSKELHFSDRRYPGIAGRIDDYAVPLRAGSTYTIKLSLDNFWCPKTKEFRLNLKSGQYHVRSEFTGKGAQSVNSDMEGIKLMNFWKGTLRSDATLLRIEEQGPSRRSD